MTYLSKHSVLGAGLLGLMLVVSACASSTFRADVNRFHQLSAPNGEGATIIAAEGIESGIEFNTYAEMIGAKGKPGFVLLMLLTGSYQGKGAVPGLGLCLLVVKLMMKTWHLFQMIMVKRVLKYLN